MTWKIHSTATNAAQLLLEESLFFTGNGYLGVRGNFEEMDESDTETIRGTYINGFYDDVPITYGEKMPGYPESQQKLLNVMDTQTIEIWVGTGEKREKFSLHNGTIIAYERNLLVDKGVTERRIHWRSTDGFELNIHFLRMASFTTKNLFSQVITLEPLHGDVPITIISNLNGDVSNYTNPDDPRVGSGHQQRLLIAHMEQMDVAQYLELTTAASHLTVATLSELIVHSEDVAYAYAQDEKSLSTTASFLLTKKTVVEKRSFFTDSRREKNLQMCLQQIHANLKKKSSETILAEQTAYLQQFWERTNITIVGDSKLQEAIRFNLFHILQSAGQDAISNIAAKGLSGEGYEGHYFWDTEIYLLPVLTMTNPALAKQLLLFRFYTLPQAKERALEMGHKRGALFPWRTITGQECSAFFPAGTAQYHISADIAHSYIQYYLATGDIAFVKEAGAEVLLETARLWLEVGHYYEGHFRIDAVTGPDEYTCIVNNNYYTNVMAKQNLQWTVQFCELLQKNMPQDWVELATRLNVEVAELAAFQRAADNMYLPVDQGLQINPQDDTFLQKQPWNFADTPREKYPLLLHYHPLTIYRYQVCKQADTVLAHLLQEDEQTEEVIRNSYYYYENITSHDSSLSSCVFSMMAARIGELEKAYQYFLKTARLDLDNTQHNTKDGLHLANMGGTWLGIVVGFAGMRLKASGLSFRPQLPNAWQSYAFNIHYRGNVLAIIVSKKVCTFTLLSGEKLTISVWNEPILVERGRSVTVDVKERVQPW